MPGLFKFASFIVCVALFPDGINAPKGTPDSGKPGHAQKDEGEALGVRGPMPFKGLRKFQRTVQGFLSKWPDFVFTEGLTDEKTIALSFDDGPSPEMTPKLLRVLRDKKVKATFFLVGELAARHPDLIKQIAEEGHAIAGHGFIHSDFRKMSPKKAFDFHIKRTDEILEKYGGSPIGYFRPPFGLMTDRHIKYFGERDVKTVFWSIDSLDWHKQHQSKAQVVTRVLAQAHPGALVLLHSGKKRGHTLAALPEIITKLKARGYTFTRADDLLGFERPEL